MKFVLAGLCVLWLGLMACSAMSSVRFVNAEDDCLEGRKPLLPLEGDRASACIHPDRAAESVREQPVITGV